MGRFTGKSVVVTGGSSGIGLTTARRIVTEGGRVLVTGTDPQKLENVRDENLLTLVNDSGDPAAADALADEARALFGTIDALFLNAGIGGSFALGEITPDVFRRIVDVNIGGPLFGAQAIGPLICEGGAILIVSADGRRPCRWPQNRKARGL